MTVFAAADRTGLGADELLTHRTSSALTAGAALLALALIAALALVLPRARAAARPVARHA